MSNISSQKMGEMPIAKLVFDMSMPVIIAMIVQALYNVVDSIFVGQFSGNALEAVSLAFPIQNLMISFAIGIAVGTNSLVARALGENNKKKASDIANSGIFISICGYILFAVVGAFAIAPFYQMQTGIKEVERFGIEYLSISTFFGIGIFIEITGERLLQAVGKTKLSMISQAIGAGINIVLDPIFIFGYLGFPKMGVRGAAIATVIGQIAAAVIAILFNILKNKEIKFSLRKIISPRFDDIKNIFRIGFPSFVLNAITSLLVLCMNIILRGFSEDAITAYGIFFKLLSFIYLPIFGLNNGLVPILSYNLGNNRIDRIKKAYKLGLISTTIYMIIGTILFEIFAPLLLGIFSAQGEVLTIGISATRIMSLGFVLSGIVIINATLFQSVGNPTHSLIVTLLRHLIFLEPVAYLLSKTGVLTNVWWSLPIAEVATFLVSLIFYKKLKEKLNHLEEKNAKAEV